MQQLAAVLDRQVYESGATVDAVAVAVGVTASTVSRWLSGKSKISRHNVAAVADYLGISLSEALTMARTEQVRVEPATVTATASATGATVSVESRLSTLEGEVAQIRRLLERSAPPAPEEP
jgi:transcriptional regulator with XRE-family HTH domain